MIKKIFKKIKKIPEIFDYKEKKKFIQTLLIVVGLIVAFNKNTSNIFSLFVLFISSCLSFIIWISVLEKTDKKTKKENLKRYQISNYIFSGFVAFTFSAILARVGMHELSGDILTVILGIVIYLVLYAVMGFVLYCVLLKEKTLKC